MESDVLHMVSPYHKRSLARASSEIVVSDINLNQHSQISEEEVRMSPRVLDYEA
jgi:hypothetical protein